MVMLPLPGLIRRKWSLSTLCPCKRIAGRRGTGKPLQLAVDIAPGTTEATQDRLAADRKCLARFHKPL